MIRVKADGSLFKMDLNNVMYATFDAIYDYTRGMANEIESATSSWRRPVKFTVKRGAHGAQEVMTSHPYFKFVDEGTRVMYVKLSSNWQSKSTPRSLRMGPGSGRVLKKGYAAGNHGHIHAREFWIPANEIVWPMMSSFMSSRFRERGLR